MKIYKYPISFYGVDDVYLQGKIVHVGMQNGIPEMWATFDDDVTPVRHRLVIVGTGHEVPVIDGAYPQHIGTIIDGMWVWHLMGVTA